MNDRQWQEAWDIFRTASQLAGEERRSFLTSVHTDPEIFQEVVSMLEEPAGEPSPESSPEPPSKIGARFGRYRIVGILGSGGMGQVYSAHDTELDRMVAVKFLAPEMVASRPAVERLVREAKAASALNHPHIVTVYEVIRAGGEVAIAMELVEGAAIRNFCGKPQEISKVIHWGRQIAQALAAAHQRDIMHRDIKPENLMVREDGILKVLDFGLARHVGADHGRSTNSSSMLAGTLNYMAPEQTRAEAATSASDVFSLGIVLFELATGTHPFRVDSPIDTAHAIAHAEPKPPSALNPGIPSALNALLLAMLDKDPSKRPSAFEVDRQLSELSLAPAGKPSRRILWAAASILAVGMAAVSILSFRERIFAPKEPVLIQLTTQVNENRVTAAAVSPDGKSLAFAAFGGSVHLRRMSDGFSQPLSTPAGLRVDRIAWFPDGSKLLLSGSLGGDDTVGDSQPGIWVMATSGGQPWKIMSDGKDAVPSPDGTRIALTSLDGSIVWVAGADGARPRQIRSGGQTSSFSSLIWSPDSKRVAYQRADYVPAVDRQTDAKSAQLSSSYRYGYESADVETGRVAASVTDLVMTSACGLPDGRVLFLRWPSPARNVFHQLWELPTDPRTGRLQGPPRRLTHDENISLSSLSASSDGKQVVTVRSMGGLPNIYVADLPPAGQVPDLLKSRRLTFSEADEYPHAWTADSRTIVFESDRNGRYDLYRQAIDQREAEPLVVSPISKVMAQLSPDGQWLLYRESRDQVTWKVMRVPVQGGTPQPVLTDMNLVGEFRCGLQAGARCVLRTVENDQFVFHELLPLGGKGRELARTGRIPTVVGDWDLSPDGTQVAIPNHDAHDAKVRLVALDPARTGVEEKTVTLNGLKNLNGIVWAADGRGWYISIRAASGWLLTYVDLQGRISKLLESVGPTYAVPSPDGRHIAFPEWTVSSNAWLFHGL
jgi:Tol biopolymer transport system component